MNLILETTTGKLVPAGAPAQLSRGGVQPLTLQFLTNGVAGLLAGGAPISLKIFSPADLVTPVATVNAWAADAVKVRYTGSIDTLVGALAWVQSATYLARVDYGDPTVASSFFHLVYGEGSAAPGSAPTVVVSQPQGVTVYHVPMVFSGKLTLNQIFGYFRAKAAGNIIGVQLSAQNAPSGADAQIDLVDAGDAELGKIATLAAGEKVGETIFGAAQPVAIGDVVRCKIKQIGSGNAGGYLTANLIVQNV